MPVAILLLFALALGGVLWAVDREVEDTLERAATDRGLGAAQQVAAFFGPSAVSAVAQLTRTVADTPAFRDYVHHPTAATTEAVTKALTALATPAPRRAALFPVDPARPPVDAAGSGPGDVVLLPPIPRPFASGVGPFHVVNGTMVVDIIVAVTGPETSTPLAFLAVRMPLSVNPPGIIGRLIGTDARAAFGNRDGTEWIDLTQMRAAPAPQIDLQRAGAASYRDSRGDRYLGSLVPVTGTPWASWVEFPEAVVVAHARSLMERLAGIGLIFVIACGVMVRFVITRVTSPLAVLTQATEAVAAGNYARHVEITQANEIGRLGRAFNAMATKVDEARRDLEVRVEDRTRALNDALAALRKRSEAQDAYLAAIVDGSADAVIGQTLDLTIQSVNAAAEQLYGYTAAELIGRSSRRLVTVERQVDVDEVIARVRRGERIRDLDTVRLAKDGSAIPVQITISPIADGTGTVIGLASVARDMRERRQLEEQLRQAQKMEAIGQLAGGVAHDFNNLLTAIMGFGQLVFEDLGPGHPQRGDVEEIVKAGERAKGLTKQLLAFSRKQAVRPVVVDINAVVTETGNMLRRLIGEHIQLATTLAPGLGTVRADPGQLDQILMNLSVNARDAMPGGGRLTIETANVTLDSSFADRRHAVRPGPYVMLAVSDSGVGMTAETRARLFEPFFTTKGEGKGTGLGLATVYGIVQQNDGHLYVYSEPGRGATFKIYFPRVDAAIPSAAETRAAAVGGSERVLLVEDERAVRLLARTMLEGVGYHVVEADSADDVDMVLDANPVIDLLVTDVILPGSTGPAVFQRLAATRPTLRVLYISGYTTDAMMRDGQLPPGATFLQKPFSANDLLLKVRAVIDAQRV